MFWISLSFFCNAHYMKLILLWNGEMVGCKTFWSGVCLRERNCSFLRVACPVLIWGGQTPQIVVFSFASHRAS